MDPGPRPGKVLLRGTGAGEITFLFCTMFYDSFWPAIALPRQRITGVMVSKLGSHTSVFMLRLSLRDQVSRCFIACPA
jgi:hypothetical protein